MRIKPVVCDHIQTRHTSFEVNLTVENNITFIFGDSGMGKSVVFSILRERAVEDRRLKCYNYLDKNKNYKTTIKRSKRKLFIIDNADILLDDALRGYIAMDGLNQYIIIGRNPTGLMLSQGDIMALNSEISDCITRFTLKHAF